MPAAAVPEGMLPGMVLLSGSAVNQDGRSSSLTAPNGPSQQGVIRQALQAGGVAEVSMVQMHGTGTPLGGKLEPPPPPLPIQPSALTLNWCRNKLCADLCSAIESLSWYLALTAAVGKGIPAVVNKKTMY